MSDGPDPGSLDAFVGARLARYVDLWSAAGAKLAAGDYHADDLVDDWFRWVGLVAQDTTAAATVIVRAASGETGGPAADPRGTGAPPG